MVESRDSTNAGDVIKDVEVVDVIVKIQDVRVADVTAKIRDVKVADVTANRT